jgi:hypothetical protein
MTGLSQGVFKSTIALNKFVQIKNANKTSFTYHSVLSSSPTLPMSAQIQPCQNVLNSQTMTPSP